MPEYATLLVFTVAALALTASPGPDMVLIASRSAAQGRIAGLATWAGIATGTYCHALAAAFGLSHLFLAVPLAYDIVRYIGAAYLLYLAYSALTSPPDRTGQPIRQRSALSALVMFRQGLLTNLLNPKMVIFVLALFPQFISPHSGSVVGQFFVLATVLNTIGFFVNGVVILTASRLSHLIAGSSRIKAVSTYLLATVFAGLAARLAFETQR